MSTAASLREAWAIAGTTPARNSLRAVSLEGTAGRISATLNASGHSGLLILVGPETRLGPTVASISRVASALTAEVYSFVDKGREARGLHVWCVAAELVEAFTGFCDPLIQRCVAGEDVPTAVDACFDEFRRLLDGEHSEAVTPADVGLLGELVVLSELVQMSPSAIDLWAYPNLERHDFRNGSTAMEVKTTLRSQQGRPIVKISAIDQLEAPPGGSLYLQWLRLERDTAGPITFPGLIGSIASRIGASEAALFRRRLGDGALSALRTDYAFTIQERAAYLVDGAFPRLSPSRLKGGVLDRGVGRVVYEIDLSGATAHKCSVETASAACLRGCQP